MNFLKLKTEFRQMFQAIGMTSNEKKKDHDQLMHWLNLDPLVFGKQQYQIALIIFPLLFQGAMRTEKGDAQWLPYS